MLFSADMSSYDENMRNVTAFERAYVFPHEVTAIATTSTKFGITSKDIIGEHIRLDFSVGSEPPSPPSSGDE